MAGKTGKNLKFLRENNKKEVLKYLTVHGEASRIELSKVLGLSKMTITNIVSDLIASQFIYETETLKAAVTTGPKPMLLAIRPGRILAVGIYISRSRIIGALTDIVGGELYTEEEKLEREFTREPDPELFLFRIIRIIQKLLFYGRGQMEQIAGIGISMVGLVDSENGILVRSTDFMGDNPIPIKERLEAEFPLPVFAQNDMQATALAEQIYGIGKNCNDFVYFGITNGIGTAVISGGKVLKGSRGFAVEAGHMSVDFNGPLCGCGNRGCVELYASIPVLLRKTNSQSLEEIMEKYEKGEKQTNQVMEEFILGVSTALTNLSNIFDIEKIIIGYEGALLKEGIFKAVEENINRSCIWRKERKVEIQASSLKDLGPLRGAAAIVFQKVFDGAIM